MSIYSLSIFSFFIIFLTTRKDIPTGLVDKNQCLSANENILSCNYIKLFLIVHHTHNYIPQKTSIKLKSVDNLNFIKFHKQWLNHNKYYTISCQGCGVFKRFFDKYLLNRGKRWLNHNTKTNILVYII